MFNGTSKVLEAAVKSNVKSMVFLSTMEVYGTPETDEKIFEDHGTNLDMAKIRSCYPESKRLCELLCSSYFSEYGVPVKTIRLTQTFGPGVGYSDGRVFADFARCLIEKRDIVLKTKGETKRNYLYLADAVTAILTVLTKGENGQLYNAANEATYCSIYEMAELVASLAEDESCHVVIDETGCEKRGFAPTLKMNLDTSKLRSLGWRPTCDLKQMFEILVSDMQLKKESYKCLREAETV